MNPPDNQPTPEDPLIPGEGGNLIEDVTDLLQETVEGIGL